MFSLVFCTCFNIFPPNAGDEVSVMAVKDWEMRLHPFDFWTHTLQIANVFRDKWPITYWIIYFSAINVYRISVFSNQCLPDHCYIAKIWRVLLSVYFQMLCTPVQNQIWRPQYGAWYLLTFVNIFNTYKRELQVTQFNYLQITLSNVQQEDTSALLMRNINKVVMTC